MPTFSNLGNFRLYCNAALERALDVVSTKMCDELTKSIDSEFYQQYSPRRYKRTKQFLNSAFKTNVTFSGNEMSVEIGVDYDKLNYERIDGYSVVELASRGYHGLEDDDLYADGFFWQNLLDKYPASVIKQMVIEEFKRQCK